jgi:hypothetical protein
MGTSTTTQNTSSTSQATPTAAEQEMEKIQLGQYKEFAPAQTQMYQNAFGLGNQLLTSFQGQGSPQWNSLIGGVNQNQQNSIVQQGLNSISPQLQQSGIMDSGTAASVMGRSAADLYNQNAQFNVGALQNALNLALTGQAQVQQPAMGATSQLASQLSGLRSNTTTGSMYGTQVQPFAQTFNQMVSPFTSMFKFGCWVAAEIFGGWYEPKTCAARYYINSLAPTWFKNFYLKYGEKTAKFIHNKPIFKMLLRPLFEYFAYRGSVVKVGGLV